ncbi:hypothetical protein TSUD_24040 [Trifolium subterraneum]|uniref:Uncharacterized protein n=1 Tax=Trifolium subterraneum TaxID=3900 RepID=A0A2Z6P648_TRISU|nr:hypothetical protein TSUD_24040 [Trifolium subterraneum]
MLRTTTSLASEQYSTRIPPSWLPPHPNHSNSRITFTTHHHHKSLVVKCSNMTVTPRISVNDGNLVVHGKTILTGVPDNIVLTPETGKGIVTGAFIGATASNTKSLRVFPIGALQ